LKREHNTRGWSLREQVSSLLRHYEAVRTVPWGPLVRRAATLLPDYFFGRGKTHGIMNVTLETTYRCNARCSFCFLRGSRLNLKGQELSLAEIDALARDVRHLVVGFYVTGGEPFVRKDAVEIIAAIKKYGFTCGVNTNATLLDEDKIRRLGKAGLDYLLVSMHGDEEAHDRVIGNRGAYQKATATVRLARDLAPSVRVALNCVITPETLQTAESLILFAKESQAAAVTFEHGQFLTRNDLAQHWPAWRRHYGNGHVRLVFSSENTFAAADPDSVYRRVQQVRAFAAKHGVCVVFKPDLSAEALKAWYSDQFAFSTHCYYPWTDTRISPFGDVYVCQFIPLVVGNVRTDSLRTLLNSERYVAFRNALRKAGGAFPACARCCKLYRMPFTKIWQASGADV